MLNRLFTALAIVSVLLALTTAALWWRGAHGHSDTVFHVGGTSANQTTLYTGPAGMAARVQRTMPDGSIGDRTQLVPFRTVLGGTMLIPALWVAVRVRRRLLPRRPGAELPSLRSLR